MTTKISNWVKSLLPYIIILVFLLVAVFTISLLADKKNAPQDAYANNKIESKIKPQQLPETENEAQNKTVITKILESIKPIITSLSFKNIVIDDDNNTENNSTESPLKTGFSETSAKQENTLLAEITESQDQTTLLGQVGAKESDSFGQVASPFGGSTLSQQCGGGPAPVAGIGKTFSGVTWAYDVCSSNSPEIEISHPLPACVNANYSCPPPFCFCVPTIFTVSQRDIMYPIVTTGASTVYSMLKTKCTCAPVACNVICSPRAWTWDSATNTCVCS